MNRSKVTARRPATRTLALLTVAWVVAACTGVVATVPPATIEPSAAPTFSPSPTVRASVPPSPRPVFSSEAFADIDDAPVSEEQAAAFQAILVQLAGRGGMTAAVMTADGTWTGAAGKADGTHDLLVESQFGIASVTKSLIAAQVMQLVDAGKLALDDAAADHLPADLGFDTNGATIRQLLSMRAGIPDWYGDAMEREVATNRSRAWEIADVLGLVGPGRSAAGEGFLYADTNYNLLGLVIEHVRQQPLVDVLRDGVFRVDGAERLIYQPGEAPTDPIAMPRGEASEALEQGGGYIPSLADASSAGPAGAIASDSISLARWWRAFCAGDVVSEASLIEMTTLSNDEEAYGLGLLSPADPYASGVGHLGKNFGYVSWAGCLPGEGAVIVVLANYDVDDIYLLAEPFVNAIRSR